MSILSESKRFVNNQRQRVADIVVRHPEDRNAKRTLNPIIFHFDKTLSDIDKAEDLISELQENLSCLTNENSTLKNEIKSLSHSLGLKDKSYNNLALTSEDLQSIPEELKKELSITDSDHQEFFIFDMLKNAGGAMSLDQILVGYYKEKNEVVSRAKMNQRMYRMVQKEMVYSMANKKGAYSIYFDHNESAELNQSKEGEQ